MGCAMAASEINPYVIPLMSPVAAISVRSIISTSTESIVAEIFRIVRTVAVLDDQLSEISFFDPSRHVAISTTFVGVIHTADFRWHSIDGASER